MRIEWINHKGQKRDITDMVASVSWGGSTSQVARNAEISIVNAPNDKNITSLKVILRNGDIIKLYEDGKNIYYGQVLRTGKVSDTGNITYSTYDFMYHLTQSTYTHKFKNKTPEAIAKYLCTILNIKVGSIAKTKRMLSKLIADDMGVYNIIMKAYTKAAKTTKKKYIARMTGNKFNVFVKGSKVENFTLDDRVNLSNVSYEETAENVINKVIIYNDKRKQLGVVKDDSSIKTFGIFQATYTKEEKVNARTAAKALLQGTEKTISVTVLQGNINCIAGNGVKVHDTATGLDALFWIESDTHMFENGIHTMSLELSYKNIWDKQED